MPTLSVFTDVPLARKLEGSLLKTYKQDDCPNKMFLAYRACMTKDGSPWVSDVVHKTRLQIAEDPSLDYEYLPTMGMKSFIQASLELLFGKHSHAIMENRVGGVHTVGDSGAFQLGVQFLRTWCRDADVVYIVSSQQEPHGLIFRDMGFTVHEHCIWDPKKLCMDPNILFNVLEQIPSGCVLVVGNIADCKLTQSQWIMFLSTLKSKQIFPFFDVPCQGLHSGDLEEDTKILRYFVSSGFEFFCSQSLSRSFGIYADDFRPGPVAEPSQHGCPHHHLHPLQPCPAGRMEAESKRNCREHHAHQGEGEGEAPAPGNPWLLGSHHPAQRHPWLPWAQLPTGGIPDQEEAYLHPQEWPD
ncbi:putative aspartate aminotransferase, cytoplasmic 2 isoform X3 [Microcebus murinus]|uniref:putative aspartate aminotransferase, cytoplasmic 2 isoform X3 n=1 Tax=Microcebus murinus TaxID=30608 RepID=UPI000642BD8C|nr:putative aspartate aminotransferase, cytoplasmic 2 isoform X3 [Microcebus murinus]